MFNRYSEILLMFFYGLHYPYNFVLCFVLCIFCIVFSVNSSFSALACSSGLKGSCVLSVFVLGLGSVSLEGSNPASCNWAIGRNGSPLSLL
ncbi:hypothetical protein FIM45_06710 [Helicobacter pylori]|nr:hypothetical protein FIM49_05065 [Helicobacter pylori]TPH93386.1 hypothetical protein FIM45_06710 [Helicobacter pylori]